MNKIWLCLIPKAKPKQAGYACDLSSLFLGTYFTLPNFPLLHHQKPKICSFILFYLSRLLLVDRAVYRRPFEKPKHIINLIEPSIYICFEEPEISVGCVCQKSLITQSGTCNFHRHTVFLLRSPTQDLLFSSCIILTTKAVEIRDML